MDVAVNFPLAWPGAHGFPGASSYGPDAVYAPGAGLQGVSLGVQESLEGS